MAFSGASSRDHGLRKLARAAGPEYVRSLVDSGSTPRLEAPATTVVVSASAELTTTAATVATAATARSDAQRAAWNVHLAQLLHSMYLVTLIEKAQLGAMYTHADTAVEPITVNDAAGVPKTTSAPTCVHSISIDERWLDAVTRYCHFTFTLDDVARVAMVFPDLLQARWTLEQQHRNPDLSSTGPSPVDVALLTPPSHKRHKRDGGASPLATSSDATAAASAAALGGKLVGRVYLLQSRVISVDEAEKHLQDALQRKGSAAAQRAWKAVVNHHTAYAAYLEKQEETRKATVSAAAAANGEALRSEEELSTPIRRSGDGPAHGAHKEGTASALLPIVEDEELLQQISAELRASLSDAKLQELLHQMRQDAARVEEQEQQRIAQRQLQERLVNTYEHVRALFGPKEKHGRSAAALIAALRQESRFEDVLDIPALLSALLEIPASGLSATQLVDARVVAEPAPPPAPAKGVTTRSRRKKAAEETAALPPAVVVRVTEPSVQAVTDLRGLTEEELDVVLVRFDRAKGSVKGVLEATAHREAL